MKKTIYLIFLFFIIGVISISASFITNYTNGTYFTATNFINLSYFLDNELNAANYMNSTDTVADSLQSIFTTTYNIYPLEHDYVYYWQYLYYNGQFVEREILIPKTSNCKYPLNLTSNFYYSNPAAPYFRQWLRCQNTSNIPSVDFYYNETALISATDFGVKFIEEKVYVNDSFWECDNRTGETVIYNFTMRDETNNSIISGDIYVDISIGSQSELSLEKINTTGITICTYGESNRTVNGLIRYTSATTNDYYIINNFLPGYAQYITLYNFKSDTNLHTLQATIRDDTWDIYPNVIGILERYYPENHTWLAVQQGKTGEFGTMFFNIFEETTEYRFKFYSTAGTLLKSTDTMKFLCDASTGRCSLTFQISSPGTVLYPINSVYFYDNTTKIVNVSWNDATGITQAVRVRLTKETLTGQLVICDSTVNSANGTIKCNTTGYFGTGILTIKATQSPEEIEKKVTIELTGFPKLYDNMSKEDSGIFVFMIAGTLAFVGLTGSPVMVIVSFLFGLFLILLFNMAKIMTITLMGSFLVIGIMIALKVKK